MICEIVAPKKTLVRELSAESYLRNTLLPTQAVTHYVDQIAKSPEWLRPWISRCICSVPQDSSGESPMGRRGKGL